MALSIFVPAFVVQSIFKPDCAPGGVRVFSAGHADGIARVRRACRCGKERNCTSRRDRDGNEDRTKPRSAHAKSPLVILRQAGPPPAQLRAIPLNGTPQTFYQRGGCLCNHPRRLLSRESSTEFALRISFRRRAVHAVTNSQTVSRASRDRPMSASFARIDGGAPVGPLRDCCARISITRDSSVSAAGVAVGRRVADRARTRCRELQCRTLVDVLVREAGVGSRHVVEDAARLSRAVSRSC